jgi:hypothetical protein
MHHARMRAPQKPEVSSTDARRLLRFCHNKPFGQAVAGSMAAVPRTTSVVGW